MLDFIKQAQRIYRTVRAHVKLREQRTEHDGRVTLESFITVTWILRSEHIIQTVRIVIGRLDLAADDSQRERQSVLLGAVTMWPEVVIEELKERGLREDSEAVRDDAVAVGDSGCRGGGRRPSIGDAE